MSAGAPPQTPAEGAYSALLFTALPGLLAGFKGLYF